jgi:hypothetical protein
VSGITQVDFRRPARSGVAPLRPKKEFGGTDYSGKLDYVDSRPAQQTLASRRPTRGGPPRRGSVSRWAPWAVVGLAAAVGASVLAASLTAAACVVVLAGAATMLGWRCGEGRRAALEQDIDDRSTELTRALSELEIAQAETVRRLSMAVEFRDEDTGAHIERIGRFSTLLAEQVGMESEFSARLSHAAPLHDVGKVAIPDAILLKPGPLTPEERAIVETHAEEGHRLLQGSSSSILDMAATIALSHHEKWDGSGYPRGVVGEAIPLEGRIVAIADVFDALTSDRIYRKAFAVEEAVQIMREQRGRHFDPVLLDAFLEVLGSSGPDAREQVRADPLALMESTHEMFVAALERGDAETAESAIAQAIEDGVPAGTLHDEVIEPALRWVGQAKATGRLEEDAERPALVILRRVLATLYRYVLGRHEEPEALERISRSVQAVEARLESEAPSGGLRADDAVATRDPHAAKARAVG